jgi:hypothetical protein
MAGATSGSATAPAPCCRRLMLHREIRISFYGNNGRCSAAFNSSQASTNSVLRNKQTNLLISLKSVRVLYKT